MAADRLPDPAAGVGRACKCGKMLVSNVIEVGFPCPFCGDKGGPVRLSRSVRGKAARMAAEAKGQHECQWCGADLWTWCDYRGCSICFEAPVPVSAAVSPAEPPEVEVSDETMAKLRYIARTLDCTVNSALEEVIREFQC